MNDFVLGKEYRPVTGGACSAGFFMPERDLLT
jgi:hypothetical protein